MLLAALTLLVYRKVLKFALLSPIAYTINKVVRFSSSYEWGVTNILNKRRPYFIGFRHYGILRFIIYASVFAVLPNARRYALVTLSTYLDFSTGHIG